MRKPGEILAHIGDLYDWALSIAVGQRTWHNSKPLPWPQEVERFFTALKKFDDFLASNEPVQAPLEKLFQGPVADSYPHRTNCHAAAHGGFAGQRRKLFRCRDCGGPCRSGPGKTETRVLIQPARWFQLQ